VDKSFFITSALILPSIFSSPSVIPFPAPRQTGRVALLGIACRHISVKFTQKTRKPSQPKPLPASVKTMADWIRVKLHEHGMASYHLAFKMGIASALVNDWKNGNARPSVHHIHEMVRLLGKYCPSETLPRRPISPNIQS
jgi:hypothetical protein